MNYELIKFKDGEFELDVNVSPDEDTVWLTQEQLCQLFQKSQSTISYHINQAILDGEINKDTSIEIFDIRVKNRPSTLYNLDVIISVGYRVHSNRGILFRKWATKILKEYLIKGHSINVPRLEANEINFLSLVNLVQSLQLKIISDEERISKLESESLPNQKLIINNTQFDSRIFFKDLLNKSKASIVIIDPYVDINTLDILKYRPTEASLTIITSDKSFLSKKELKSFVSQYGEVALMKTNLFHDRYLIIDSEFGYHVGISLNHIGKKISQVSLLDKEILELLIYQINKINNQN